MIPDFRIGHGYDVHRLAYDRKLILGGVLIPHETFALGLLGHSDADVLVHAAMDSILGALALGDIGRHFPDDDERYSGISSLELAAHVFKLMDDEGYELSNLDCTIIAQRPKLAPFVPLMRENLACVFGAEISRINVKATTEEHLGFTGAGAGIAAHAVCLLCRKSI